MDVALRILNGPRVGHRLFLRPQQQLCVGRTDRAAVALPDDAMLSGIHFRIIRPATGHCRVDDLGSKNGTFVNGRRVTSCGLETGDYITAGVTVFEVEAI